MHDARRSIERNSLLSEFVEALKSTKFPWRSNMDVVEEIMAVFQAEHE